MAKQGPPDKNSNFSLAVTYTKRSAPPNTDDDGEFEDVQVTQKQVTFCPLHHFPMEPTAPRTGCWFIFSV